MTTGRRAALTHVASYLPAGKITNDSLVENYPGWTSEKIEAKTGIRVRNRVADDEFTSDLAIQAAERLFEQSGFDREQVDFLFLVTVTPDQILPFTASTVQNGLKLPTSVGATDLSLACSGYPYALAMAASMIESGRVRNVLLCTADRFTAYADEAEMGSKTLFGDAGTATLVQCVEPGASGAGTIGLCRFGTDGSGAQHLIVPTSGIKGFVGHTTTSASKPTFEMNGPEVFDFTIRTVSRFIADFLAEAELEVDAVDYFVFHQANLFMLEHLRRRMKIPKERFVIHLAEVGNTSSSTIPLALADLSARNSFQPGQTAVLVGFGTGYSWSATRVDFT
ncbi:ketoacyl-ACP synthase III [Engelhardtia mirabilis]|uniref:3-oxoacyl-[acyl-carrier-protein] synthase 3 n=1 Tax=Engelhardtia mirabilis TaxID=2528011 RepID=A0A518BNB5_9BACT|nr:3-oxoacyl-[acyl-carrier-protein] synthase 3 [Planctomycetes bacterium Pla133]QDV02771.1 3-oxoacyl-[acyl-carrier-protein] synthase 3 [Planctomycetes bacterium Pla86]